MNLEIITEDSALLFAEASIVDEYETFDYIEAPCVFTVAIRGKSARVNRN